MSARLHQGGGDFDGGEGVAGLEAVPADVKAVIVVEFAVLVAEKTLSDSMFERMLPRRRDSASLRRARGGSLKVLVACEDRRPSMMLATVVSTARSQSGRSRRSWQSRTVVLEAGSSWPKPDRRWLPVWVTSELRFAVCVVGVSADRVGDLRGRGGEQFFEVEGPEGPRDGIRLVERKVGDEGHNGDGRGFSGKSLLSFSHDLAWEFFLIENPKLETAISQSNLHIWLRYFVCEV
jgi:hypothetical protein